MNRFLVFKYHLFCFISLLLCAKATFSQTPYGNEWIKPNQQYFRINVNADGIYRINAAELQNAGITLSAVAIQNIQIFCRGVEIPIFIGGEADGVFDVTDFIEFYGKKNDGELDKQLYKTPALQPNANVSLFTDQNAYYLTIADTKGLRYSTPNVTAPLTPEGYMVYTASGNFAETYYPGEYILAAMSLSEYIEGEGYLGNSFGLGQTQGRTLATPGAIAIPNFTPKLDFYVAGRSNAVSASNRNHHLRINIGNILINDTTFNGYATIRATKQLPIHTLDATTTINFSSVNDLGAASDFQAPGYANLTYARSFTADYDFLAFTLNSANAQCLLNFNASSWNSAFLLDVANGYRYEGQKNGANVSFKINNPGNKPLVVFSPATIKTASLEKVTLNTLNSTNFNANLLIITHANLLPAAQEYATYKESKGFKTQVVTTNNLYNQFYYGIHHPLAIKNYVRYLLATAPVKPAYLLLMGKAYEMPKNNLANDLVPTMGYPASDTYLTSEIGNSSFAPALATGRIPAKTNDEVRMYLEKVKAFDAQPDSLWRKTLINITGGANRGEDMTFSSYLQYQSTIATTALWGGKAINFYKSDTNPITTALMAKITATVNQGAGLLNFLGHGSTTNTAVSLGEIIELRNENKLLFYLINGCSTGNAFVNGSMGENYLLQSKKGAIGWIGTSSEGVASYLSNYTNIFFNHSFNDQYGNSVAKNLALAAKNYQNNNDKLNIAHLRQYIFLGDPTLSFYAPDKPDYYLDEKSAALKSTVTNQQLTLSVIVKNIGKAIDKTVKIAVQRTLSNNTIIDYPIQTFPRIQNTDTLTIELDNTMANTTGNNIFKITVDPAQETDELNEANNICQISYVSSSNEAIPIFPDNYGIVNTAVVDLKAQSSNMQASQLTYLFEIDTVKTFDSGWKKKSASIVANALAGWNVNLEATNGKTYYWRTKTTAQDANWKDVSFTYIANNEPGWNQSHQHQFDAISLANIQNNKPGFSYENISYMVRIRTNGNNSTMIPERKIRVGNSGESSSFYTSNFKGLAIIALNNLNPNESFGYPSVFRPGQAYNHKQYYFDTNQPSHVDSLLSYLNQIPNGYYVAGMSGIDFNPQALPASVKTALANLGLGKINIIQNGEPYAFWGKKGALPGTALEKTADYTSTLPPSQQGIDFTSDLMYPLNNGSYTSERIGPATKWTKASFDINANDNDKLAYNIIGISKTGTESIVKSGVANQFDLSDIDAKSFPYLRLKATVTDNIDKTAAGLKKWQVTYNSSADISFDTDFANTFYSQTVQQGDSIRLNIGVANLHATVSDSVTVDYKIIKEDRSTLAGSLKTLAPITPGNPIKLNFAYPTHALLGATTLQLSINQKNKLDTREFNNYVSYNFNVTKDNASPLVEVMFDNKRIINREIVSPEPKISIAVSDENKFLLLKDTANVVVFLGKDNNNFKRIAFADGKIVTQQEGTTNNNKAVFLYSPDKLEDGIYTLKIRSIDQSGNYIATNDFLTDFEVINEQSISNFLPYPNPFTTSMRFVFQITGKVPDKVLVRIMTIGGKIVREIGMAELGNLKIGNNISDFSWDGTDQFGDRLANGVYFYQVLTENNDKSDIKKRSNASDAFFKKNFGKIYLMR